MKNSNLDVFEEYKIENQVWIYGGEDGEEDVMPATSGSSEPEEDPWWKFW